jgi:hypothetical protein
MPRNQINGMPKMVVKKAIREYAENHDEDIRPGTPKYADLMNTVEGQVQEVLGVGEDD